eukprot:TRINITY_DN17453_c0_g1_i1.p2 TRINITY_DN17453_c0_g1~~TRINITY_DN17453_c0_g1_i1.p2  ORF type:complete len:246 (-),score=37.85 TRINITY_DN17453_c0_g1_i1:59-796(-)
MPKEGKRDGKKKVYGIMRRGTHALKPVEERGKVTGQRSFKAAVRGLERLLKKDDLPDHVRAEKEKQLESFRGKVQVHADAERDRAWKVKYRMVQFFERRKLMRSLKRAEKAGDAAAIATVRADLDYIQHFPTDRPYIALFPTGAEPNPAAIAAARAEVRRRLSARETAEAWEDDAFEPRKGGGKASGAAAAASATAAGDSRRQKGQRHKGQQSEQSEQSGQGQQQPEAEESEEDDFFTTERPHRR